VGAEGFFGFESCEEVGKVVVFGFGEEDAVG
jgi:hypothetical protein